jgi:hypothetical protein
LTLTDAQKIRIDNIACGKSIDSRIATEDQIAALREQVILLSTATKTKLGEKMTQLETVVAEEKSKKEKKVKTKK